MASPSLSFSRAARLLKLVVPAVLVGIGSALTLAALAELANRLQDVLWKDLPDAFDIGADSAVWVITVLTTMGVFVGLIVWKVPGHAGPDPATQELLSPPLAPSVLPSVALAVLLTLAGGVSLGPENPIIAINIGLAIWLGRRARRDVAPPAWVGFAVAGTLGAMFGTPIGAALVLSETPAPPDAPPLWDRLLPPLVAAAAGSLVMLALGQDEFAVSVPAYPGIDWPDVVSSTLIATAAAIIGGVAVYLFPVFHAAFQRLRHPLVMLTVGGVSLGVLGAIGGQITLFKGLSEMQQLALQDNSSGRLTVIIVVKLLAILVAGTCAFRGGRIFPAVFVGVAIGMLALNIKDDVPPAIAIGAGVLGMTLVVTRSGWLGLFMAVVIVGEIGVLPVMCIALLPVWLLVTDRPAMVVKPAVPDLVA